MASQHVVVRYQQAPSALAPERLARNVKIIGARRNRRAEAGIDSDEAVL